MDYIWHYDSPLGGITLASDGEIATRIAKEKGLKQMSAQAAGGIDKKARLLQMEKSTKLLTR